MPKFSKEDIIQGPVLFFVCFIIGLPMWLFILYPTDEAVNLLTDPGILFVIFGLWITFSIFYLIVKLSNPVRVH